MKIKGDLPLGASTSFVRQVETRRGRTSSRLRGFCHRVPCSRETKGSLGRGFCRHRGIILLGEYFSNVS